MSDTSRIEWTDATWNPVTGCTKISTGCRNCYAATMANRFQNMRNQTRYRNGFQVTLHHDLLETPLRWRKPRMVFPCSMSDLFHEDVPDEFIAKVFATMEQAKWHTFQVLTKRSARLRDMADNLPWPENVWMGVTIEGPKQVNRIDDLRSVPASMRFLSMEPLLAPIPDLNLDNIGWVIAGGESGPGWRSMDPAWAREIRARCDEAGVPFFFKQHAGFSKKRSGRVLDGRTWDAMPVIRGAGRS